MKKLGWLHSILPLLSLAFLVLSLYSKEDWALIVTTVLVAVNLVLTIYFQTKKSKKDQLGGVP